MPIVIRKGKDVRRCPRSAAGRKPARLGASEFEMDLGSRVDMTGCNGIGFESAQWWVEFDIAETVAT
jgi:hypothetical protein